jgi:hypothetical protein
MIITESDAFRKGHHAELITSLRDSAALSTLCQKLYTRRVETSSRRTADEMGEEQNVLSKTRAERSPSFKVLPTDDKGLLADLEMDGFYRAYSR